MSEKFFSFYEINVSKDGDHLFATHERSLQSRRETRELLKLLKQKFPESEGYKLQVTGMSTGGVILETLDD